MYVRTDMVSSCTVSMDPVDNRVKRARAWRGSSEGQVANARAAYAEHEENRSFHDQCGEWEVT